MKKLLPLLTLAIAINTSIAQNALTFDGTNDVVTVANASADIANSNTMSITCWAYPTKSGGPFGITGIRNNTNADFYILQLNSTSLECRFRNSGGTNYDIVYAGLTLNQWQHYAFTFDGANLNLYINGVSVATTPASGVITNMSQEFLIGNLKWNGFNFQYGGKADEVSLWDKALTSAEVNCLYNYGIDPAASDLQLYYDFNQGIPNGNNSGKTTLTDRTGNKDGTLSGFTLSGTSSNWTPGIASPSLVKMSICTGDSAVIGGQAYYATGTYFNSIPLGGGCDSIVSLQLTVTPIEVEMRENICPGETFTFAGNALSANGTYYDTIQSTQLCDTVVKLILRVRPEYNDSSARTICFGESYNFGSQVLTESGVYTESFQSQYGCDSLIKLNLTVDTVNIDVALNGSSLIASAVQSQNQYQWYNCEDQTIVTGAVNKFFNLPDLNEYAVIVTSNETGCIDTSSCIGLVTGINDINNSSAFKLHPNPANETVTIRLDQTYQQISLTLKNMSGQDVLSRSFNQQQLINLPLREVSPGVYFIHVVADDQESVIKLVRN